ncbi:two-component system chemotaxis sensor kinase CheA [Rhodoblastus acidophilus]|uniref:chemotaxis protein CheA n=1 Tax=Rhodoblastus acidophilus TaxID=1074 RepID=UPI002225727A|nr:chemotaxis protein CheA [Rhodoblastus acidophilus]MCW2284100.1 two-component system chemotaxis sensor kinase CheA [Rhodoblastus acidophilus]MCW2332796.1 two-component system chemotaxis sensor kinase CheA [Rhodoblastus acidophilus]
MKTLLERFIPEARDLIESSSTGLLKLERTPGDHDVVNEVFRAVHTLKGSSGLFAVPALTRLVHVAEDLLGAVRSDELAIDAELIDALLSALDQVDKWVDCLEAQAGLPDNADGVSNAMVDSLRRFGGREDKAAPAGVAAPAARVDAAALAVFSEAERIQAFRAAAEGAAVRLIDYIPADNCFFCGTDPLALALETPEVLATAIAPAAPFPAADYDPYVCNLRFQIVTVAAEAELEHHFRYERAQVALAEVDPRDLVAITGEAAAPPVCADFAEDARRLLDEGNLPLLAARAKTLRAIVGAGLASACALRWLEVVAGGAAPDLALARALIAAVGRGIYLPPSQAEAAAGDSTVACARQIIAAQKRNLAHRAFSASVLAGLRSVVDNVLAALARDDLGQEFSAACERCAAEQSFVPALAFLDHAFEPGPGGPKGADAPAFASAPMPSAVAPPPPERAADPHAETKKAASRMLRVDQAKVDTLMNLIGELIVSKNSLPFLAKRAEEVFGSREMSREIKEQYAVIDRLSQEMQAAIMQVRMLPISDVFDRFPRLVRDLSRKLAKDIDLVIEGGDTSADKNIIEALNDPLLHIVRNSLDHGVEAPEDRAAAGKHARATITLKAWQDAESVVIEVCDDGRGIDPAKIAASAVKKGVISQAEADRLSEQEAINLIFRPGFSTAAQVSDLSGRGVGMDVVRTAVEKLGGRVTVSSRVGEGSSTRLVLPLSMVVTRIMIIEAASGLYGVPMELIVETVRVERAHIHRIQNAEAFILRDRLIPLVRLADRLREPARPLKHDAEAVLVCRVNGQTVGVVIDDFRVGMDVIVKPFEGIVAGARGFSGTTLLGDGRVLLILDLKELI